MRPAPGRLVSHPQADTDRGGRRSEREAGLRGAGTVAALTRAGPVLVRGTEPQARTPVSPRVGPALRRVPQLPRPGEARGPGRRHALQPLQRLLQDRLDRAVTRRRVTARVCRRLRYGARIVKEELDAEVAPGADARST